MGLGGNRAVKIESADEIPDLPSSESERRITAELLETVGRHSHVSQRKIAAELGVALGLVNLYIKRCVKKGLIKVEQVPSRRYAYYLTTKGFAEKSRLTAEYLSWSLTFFRRARLDCSAVLLEAHRRGWRAVGIVGGGDLAEIAILCASEVGVRIAAIVEPGHAEATILGVPVVANSGEVATVTDGWIVTTVTSAQAVYDGLIETYGAGRVLAPTLLSLDLGHGEVRS